MKAYVLDDINVFNLKDVDMPKPSDDEVIVNVKAAGICGSDIPRVYRNGTYSYPLILGHEFSGIVTDCGMDAEEFKGERVGVFPLIPCMNCEQCKKKQYEMCISYNYLGSRCDGAFAEYVRVPKWNLIKLPDNVSYEVAAMLEPMAVAVHAMRRAGVDSKKKIAVMGLGTIGLSLIMMLISEGCENVFAIGNKNIQKDVAIELGIKPENYIDSNTDELIDVDIFFDCVGTNAVISEAVLHTYPKGTVLLVGNPASDITFEKKVYWQILRKQLTLFGTWNSSFTHDENDDWNFVISKLSDGLIHPELLISHRYSIDDLIHGFLLMRDKSEEYIKVMMVHP